MKNLIFLAAFFTCLFYNTQESKAQFATTVKEFSSTEKILVKEYCPTCTNGMLIISSDGRCCCVKSDGSQTCGKSTTHLDAPQKTLLTQQMGIGAVDPCDDQGSSCLTLKR
ncbi:MAG: hypothetical protein IPM47_18805 [Sphingobacteriales bacterium]|nr:MAG: hypothetical protein IPM47_18805 [Sphingobacteriales bacterium]